MKCSEVIKTAWRITNTERGIAWYGIVPTFFTMLVGIGIVVYQFFAFQASPFFGGKHFNLDKISKIILDFTSAHPSSVIIFFIVAIIFGVLYFVLPPLCEGGLIGIVAANRRGKKVRPSDGIKIGIHNFLRMFEFRLAISAFSFMEFFTFSSYSLRHLGVSTWIMVLIGIFFCATFILGFFFIYAENFIVLESRSLTLSLLESAKLVTANFGKTFLMWLLMLLISARVVINVFLIFFIPALVVFVMNFFASTIALTLGILLGILVSLGVLGLAAYLTGVLHVFTTTAWTLTFISLDHQRVEKLLEK